MSGYALIVQHRTKPGKRDAVQDVWRKYMPAAVAENPNHLAYFYCYGSDPDSICAFQQYPDAEAAAAFLKNPAYARYNDEVKPLLDGEPVITVLDVQWIKPPS